MKLNLAQNSDDSLVNQIRTPWQVWLVPVVSLVFVFGSFLFILVPKVNEWSEFIREKKRSEETLEKLQDKRSSLQALTPLELERQLEQLEVVLPSFKPVIETVYSIQRLAEEFELTLGDYDLSPGLLATGSADGVEVNTETSANTQSLVFELDLGGKMSQLIAFWDRVDTVAPLVSVDTTNISIGTNEDNTSVEFDDLDVSVVLEMGIHFSEPVTQEINTTEPLPVIEGQQRVYLSQLSQYEPIDMTEFFELIELGIGENQKENPFVF